MLMREEGAPVGHGQLSIWRCLPGRPAGVGDRSDRRDGGDQQGVIAECVPKRTLRADACVAGQSGSGRTDPDPVSYTHLRAHET